LDPPISYDIMSFGMRNGSFTGVGLGNFINGSQCDYLNARQIVNGLDHAELIAVYEHAGKSAEAELCRRRSRPSPTRGALAAANWRGWHLAGSITRVLNRCRRSPLTSVSMSMFVGSASPTAMQAEACAEDSPRAIRRGGSC